MRLFPLAAESQAMEKSIFAASFRAIRATVAEPERNKWDVTDYRIKVQQSGF